MMCANMSIMCTGDNGVCQKIAGRVKDFDQFKPYYWWCVGDMGEGV